MALPFKPNELRKLIELAYLGEWVINAHHDPEHQDEAAQAVWQKLLSQSSTTEGVGQDIETHDFYIDEAWTERLYNEYVADYDDHVFWDELTERLAQRDLAKSRGVASEEIVREDDVLQLKPLEESYRVEFEHHGVDRLSMDEVD
jgi:hypothetical protein